jgi:hypothetical protein
MSGLIPLIPLRKKKKNRNCRDLIIKESTTNVWRIQVPISEIDYDLSLDGLNHISGKGVIAENNPAKTSYYFEIRDYIGTKEQRLYQKMRKLRRQRKLKADSIIWIKGTFNRIDYGGGPFYSNGIIESLFYDQKPICKKNN